MALEFVYQWIYYPSGICLLKGSNRNTRTNCEICPKLTIKTPERRHCRCSGVFIVNFENISRVYLIKKAATVFKTRSSLKEKTYVKNAAGDLGGAGAVSLPADYAEYISQGLIQAIFDIGIPILGALIWACRNLILRKTKTTIKRNSSLLIKSVT